MWTEDPKSHGKTIQVKLNNLVCKLVQAINVKIQKNKESMHFENQISVLNVPGSFQVSELG